MVLGNKTRRYEVWVNGLKKQTIQLRPFAKQTIYGEAGKEIAIVKRGFSAADIQVLDQEVSVTLRSI